MDRSCTRRSVMLALGVALTMMIVVMPLEPLSARGLISILSVRWIVTLPRSYHAETRARRPRASRVRRGSARAAKTEKDDHS